MKALAILVVAVVALMGAASAWEDGYVLQYSLKRTIAEQDDFTNMEGSNSGTWYSAPTSTNSESPHGYLTAGVTNSLVDVTPVFSNQYETGNTHQSLVQAAKITVGMEALDSEDDDAELQVDIEKHQEYAFSGQFDSMSASFADLAAAGVNYDPALRELTVCGNCHAWEDSDATGSITTSGNAKISEGAIGLDSWTSLKADGWLEVVTMDGGIAPYASFFGDSVVPNGDSVTTTVSGSATHSWNNGGGWWEDNPAV